MPFLQERESYQLHTSSNNAFCSYCTGIHCKIQWKNDQNAFSLKEYTEHELENRKDSKSIEVYTGRVQGMNFISKALGGNSFKGKLYFGKVDEVLAATIEEATGLDVEDCNLALHADEVRKIAESHGGEASENLRGQSAITVEDLLDIPEVVKNATRIKAEEYNGHDAIVFVREQGNRTTTVTYMINKKHDLQVQTMYKSNKKRGLATAYSVQAEYFTSETDPWYSPSEVNAAQRDGDVKGHFSFAPFKTRSWFMFWEKA